MARRPRHHFLLIIGVAHGLLFAAVPDAVLGAPKALDPDRHFPYRFAEVSRYAYLDISDRNWDRRGVAWDYRGDGADDLVCLTDGGVTLRLGEGEGHIQIWQEPLPVDFSAQGGARGIEGVWTFADPNRPEIVIKASTPDRFRWRFERRRADDGQLVAAFEIPGGEDLRPDGSWDGQYKVLGVAEVPTAAGPVPALITLVETGRDLQPRGVLALAADSGRELWQHLVGPKPNPEQAGLFDLDGDGAREIVFAGRGVGNLHGRTFNGTSDDTARVFVLDLAGRQRWSWPGGAYPGNAHFALVDLEGDGKLEMIVGELSNRYQDNKLRLLDAEGRLRSTLQVGAGVSGLGVLGPAADGVDLVLIRMDGSIATVRANGNGLAWLDTATMPSRARLAGVADWLPEPGPELFVATSSGAVWVLDSRLEPLARLGDGALAPADDGIRVLDGGELPSFLVAASYQTDLGRRFVLEPNPRPVPWGAFVGTLGAGGVVTLLVRRRRFRPSRATRRELRLQLLERLLLSGHGAIGGLSSLRRLLWNLDALNQGYAMNDDRRRDLLGLAHDIAATQLPNLEAALELAHLAKPGDRIAAQASDALADLKRLVQRVVAGGLDRTDPVLLAELQNAGAGAEQSFQALRRDVEAAFLAEPAQVVTQALAAHREALAAGCVAVSADLEGWPPCRMDPEELAFVIDNLVENAVRALAGSPDPRLEIDGEVCGRHFTIRVRDTGYGVAPDDWERIFEEGGPSREGGGLGLPRSRQLLRKYGGKVTVAESNPGGGTVMALTLPVNTSVAGDNPAAAEAAAAH